ncbi:mitochondrial protein Fmp26 [Emericellopsis cladophorae]|uniref:Altered inheritance of mitochondria protein 24, mitochondrial n=1 Tax=Emericellopsis cladophorae TaxID=2686198 RepID=A0A9Q0BC35_9HYPO|nr:mitochondrial protein Fmp26 [Emericellopsis cladophorae]KAI6779932.1 mitochondrial protein Fmp26 [Emericellopsis cladophorae]
MMRGQSHLVRATQRLRPQSTSHSVCRQCRAIQISAAPSSEPRAGGDAFGTTLESSRDAADARFEVLGSPYSMLSVTLSASQKLYTRRGTLVGMAGKPENAQSTLSLLNPLSRAPFGVPFLYQKITATTPITALISTTSPTTTFQILHLDGTTDWMVSQRNSLLAWTGHTLTLSSRIQHNLSMAHWGSTFLTGRGVAALAAPGQVYQLDLAEGEEFVAHPGSVVAYSISRNAPQPFRFKSSSLRLQVPSLTRWLPEWEFMRTIRQSGAYKAMARILYSLRTVTRRTIWGDRLFLQFKGPTRVIMSSQGVRVADVLSDKQVNEIADAPAGVAPAAVELATKPEGEAKLPPPPTTEQAPSAIRVAEVHKDGKVTFEDKKDLKEFV